MLLVFLTLLGSPILNAGVIQPSTVAVTVVDAIAGYPLANADVIDLASGQHRFTDEQGQARLTWPANGALRLRVREVGYQPLQRTLDRANTSDGVATFALSKVAYVISPVKETSRCVTTDDSASLALSVSVLDQLRQGAEKYDEFRLLYPFEVSMERRTAAVPKDGPIKRITVNKEKYSSEDVTSAYRPGDIIQYKGTAFLVPILVLSSLADSVFWDHHCFIARGIEPYLDTRVIRLEFSPSADVHGPDWEGDAFIDSATSLLRRINFRLVNPKPRSYPKKLDGYTTFSMPSPYIVVPDTTGAEWWYRDADDKGSWGQPEYLQMIFMQELKYRKEKPPENQPLKQ